MAKKKDDTWTGRFGGALKKVPEVPDDNPKPKNDKPKKTK